MTRFTLRVLSTLLAFSALACSSPTDPTPPRSRLTTPSAGASFDEATPDTTCRSGYINPQGRTC